jgi:hypothetical protein
VQECGPKGGSTHDKDCGGRLISKPARTSKHESYSLVDEPEAKGMEDDGQYD